MQLKKPNVNDFSKNKRNVQRPKRKFKLPERQTPKIRMMLLAHQHVKQVNVSLNFSFQSQFFYLHQKKEKKKQNSWTLVCLMKWNNNTLGWRVIHYNLITHSYSQSNTFKTKNNYIFIIEFKNLSVKWLTNWFIGIHFHAAHFIKIKKNLCIFGRAWKYCTYPWKSILCIFDTKNIKQILRCIKIQN